MNRTLQADWTPEAVEVWERKGRRRLTREQLRGTDAGWVGCPYCGYCKRTVYCSRWQLRARVRYCICLFCTQRYKTVEVLLVEDPVAS